MNNLPLVLFPSHLAQTFTNDLTIQWTDDGFHLVSAGHDDRVRVWDAATGANTLASFGPTLKNSHLSNLPLVLSPTASAEPGKELLFYPNEKELLMFELREGKLLKRLRVPGPNMAAVRLRTGERNVKSRTTGLVFRGPARGVYSAHTDGHIRAWLPRTSEDDESKNIWTIVNFPFQGLMSILFPRHINQALTDLTIIQWIKKRKTS